MKNSLRIHKWTHNEFNIFILGVLTRPPLLKLVGVSRLELATSRPPQRRTLTGLSYTPLFWFNGCKSTYLRGICKIFQTLFCSKNVF